MSFEPRNWQLFVEDMPWAISRIQERTAGRTFEEFARDQDSLEIVAWNFHVLGGASTHLPAEVIDVHPELPWADEAPAAAARTDARNVPLPATGKPHEGDHGSGWLRNVDDVSNGFARPQTRTSLRRSLAVT